MADGIALAVEGGGSHTSAAVYEGGARTRYVHGPTSNPRSISASDAMDTLHRMLLDILTGLSGAISIYVGHGAASTAREAAQLGRRLDRLRESASVGDIIVVNDLVPLALIEPTRNVVVAAAGTGTGFLARSHDGLWRRASGQEFVLSDEGGGYDIGLAALRAAIREADGRGRPTILTDLLSEMRACTPAELPHHLFETVYEDPTSIKVEVAQYARAVFAAAAALDPVARDILSAAANEICLGVTAVARALKIDLSTSLLVLTGSLLTACDGLRENVLAGLQSGLARSEVLVASDDLVRNVRELGNHIDRLRTETIRHPWLPVYLSASHGEA
ncbi:BadF/BadG/BcrA/BcrD ATPase family protein [Micromonospora sp. NPDC006766]|uniref:BadF/BadG/BcrA/BcrD ATPase family protein n=1 Tax=Micromonospora sp. NPDC006766 TaxID=3154778 RepID=UPI0033CF10A4